MSVEVKICGVRSLEMAVAAVEAGADYLGFNFVSGSRRRVTLEQAKQIVDGLSAPVKLVGVFRNADVALVHEAVRVLGLGLVQLHGDEDPDYAAQMMAPVMKVIGLADGDLAGARLLTRQFCTPYYLLDRPVQGRGGMIDLDVALELAADTDVFIAGGLTPGNVAEVVRLVQPHGVDVAGGIETNGEPDVAKIRAFIKAAKQAA